MIYYLERWTDELIVSYLQAVEMKVYNATCQWVLGWHLIFVNHLPAKYMSSTLGTPIHWSLQAPEAKLQRAYHELTNCEEGTWGGGSGCCRYHILNIFKPSSIMNIGAETEHFSSMVALTNYLVRIWYMCGQLRDCEGSPGVETYDIVWRVGVLLLQTVM